MNNYEYITASLPVLVRKWNDSSPLESESLVNEIRSQLSEKDCRILDLLLNGFRDENLNEAFYTKADKSPCRFIREYFKMDRVVRNAKVRFLNRSLGRPQEQDTIVLGENDSDFVLDDRLEEVLGLEDLLERENGIDEIMWTGINGITTFDYFNLDSILGFVARLHIVDRWTGLDEGKGRELLRKLVGDLRSTFGDIQFNDNLL